MKLVKLTPRSSDHLDKWENHEINVDFISRMSRANCHPSWTEVSLSNGEVLKVVETPDEIRKKIVQEAQIL